jgi:predicted TPR repeat methyltransferase
VNWVRGYLKQGVVVDYGSGLGHFVGALNKAGFNALGYEIDSEVRALAKDELQLDLAPLEDFHAREALSVDVITMWHVLEHIYDLNHDFHSIQEKLKSNGILMVAVPNYKSWDAQHYAKDWEAYDVPRHLYHFDNQVIKSFVESKGFNLLEVIPLRFDSYYVSMRSEVNKNGNILRGIWNGYLSNQRGRKYGYSSHVFVFRKN